MRQRRVQRVPLPQRGRLQPGSAVRYTLHALHCIICRIRAGLPGSACASPVTRGRCVSGRCAAPTPAWRGGPASVRYSTVLLFRCSLLLCQGGGSGGFICLCGAGRRGATCEEEVLYCRYCTVCTVLYR